MVLDYHTQIVNKWGHLRDFRRTGRDEYHSSCPNCGGGDPSDRFHMHPPGNGYKLVRGVCRQCGYTEVIFSNDNDISRADYEEAERIHNREKKELATRIEQRLVQIQRESYYVGFHDAMKQEHRDMWTEAGIPPEVQDWFCLGYNPEKTFKVNNETFTSDALTLPHMKLIRGDVKPVNISHRLLCDPQVHQGQKYRYEWGVPAYIFLTEPTRELSGNVLIVEGAKKAIVTWLHVGHHFNHVIGLPSCNVSSNIVDELSKFDSITLLLDPDTKEPNKQTRRVAVYEAADVLANGRRRNISVATSPCNMKPDDFLIEYGRERGTDLLMAAIDAAVLYTPKRG